MEGRQAALQKYDYRNFAGSRASDKWNRIGLKRRAGVCVPLFSLHSKKSAGIGELTDLSLFFDWTKKSGMSIAMFLPMNDVGYDFRPYDAQSTFALEPMYLDLSALKGVASEAFTKEIAGLREKFPCGRGRVNYGIKKAKMELLWKQFENCGGTFPDAFAAYKKKNRFWLEDFALFKVLKELFPENTWESWGTPYKEKHEAVMAEIKRKNRKRLQFHAWVQWQLYEQFRAVKEYAAGKGIFTIGDLPFLVSRDSADVWANQDYFKLDRVSGAPPDAYMANGQRWGMPPYRWESIAAKGYDYLVEKLRYAENFYDMFRIDHFVGLFRLWTIAANEPPENGGANGHFDPPNEGEWEAHGTRILDTMLASTKMLPCAEDLGVVPDCSYKVLREYSIPGMDVQRWQRAWKTDGRFLNPSDYRPNSVAVLSTHDMPVFLAWWFYEVGTADEGTVRKLFPRYHLDFESQHAAVFEPPRYGRLKWHGDLKDVHDMAGRLGRQAHDIPELKSLFEGSFDEREKYLEFIQLSGEEAKDPKRVAARALAKAGETSSVFSIQLIHDWLATAGYFAEDPWSVRINFPGTMGDQNWSFTLPLTLEELNRLEVSRTILAINRASDRI